MSTFIRPLMSARHAAAPHSPSGLRVLVVDDYVDGAEALSALLAVMGCTTAVAFDGAQGLAKAASFDPQLILIDLEMPDMTGCDMVQHLRTAPLSSAAWLVCLTGHGQPADRSLCIAAGFDAFYTKPMLLQNLDELIEEGKAGRWQRDGSSGLGMQS